jgi:hypothetical protein
MSICIGFQSWLVPAHQGPIGLVFAMDFRPGWSFLVRICCSDYFTWSSESVCPDSARFNLVGTCLIGLIMLGFVLVSICLGFQARWSRHLGARFDGSEHSTNDLTLLDGDLA